MVNIFSFLHKILSKKNFSTVEKYHQINVGDIVTITLKNPHETGLVDPSKQLSKRFDPEDLETLKLTGTLTRKFHTLDIDLLEMVCVKTNFNTRRERLYCFMIDEIKDIKKIEI